MMEDNNNDGLRLPQNIKYLPRRLQEKILRESEVSVSEQSLQASASFSNENDSKDEAASRGIEATPNVIGEDSGKHDLRNKSKSVRSRSQGKVIPDAPKLLSRHIGDTRKTYQPVLEHKKNIFSKYTQPEDEQSFDKTKRSIAKNFQLSNTGTKFDSNSFKVLKSKENNKYDLIKKSNSLENLVDTLHLEKEPSDQDVSRENSLIERRNEKVPSSRMDSPQSNKTTTRCIKKRSYHLSENCHTRPVWFDIIYDVKENSNRRELIIRLVELDFKINTILKEHTFLQQWDLYIRLQRDVHDIFLKFLKKDLKFCCKENIELYFWKTLYHNVIEILKKKMQNAEDEKENNFVKNKALDVINSGCQFYERALRLLQEEYNFDLTVIINTYSHCRKKDLKFQQIAIVSAQKLLLCLGDLSRYKELINKTQNYDDAKQHYTDAQKLIPTNGIPYNQLALLAIYSKKKFDSIYFHMRSLVASNPIYSAKESLKVLFDELRKKHEDSLKKTEVVKPNTKPEAVKRTTPANMRREIWNHPNGSRRLHRIPSVDFNSKENSEQDDLCSLSTMEISKRFTSSFLYLHGKLFTGIGLENFYSNAVKMLAEFKSILHRTPLMYTRERLLQITALNIFSIDFNNKEDLGNVRKGVRNYALGLSFLMFSLIVNRILKVFQANGYVEAVGEWLSSKINNENGRFRLQEENDAEFDKDVCLLLSTVNIWCDWMKNNVEIWKTTNISQHDGFLECQKEIDFWEQFAKLTSLIADFVTMSSNLFVPSSDEDVTSIILDEELLFDGFSPPILNMEDRLYCKKQNLHFAKNIVRLKNIYEFGSKFLCETIPPILKEVTIGNKVRYAVASAHPTQLSLEADIVEKFEDLSENVEDFERQLFDIVLDFEEEENTTVENPEIVELRRRKSELEKKHRMQEQYQQKLQHILSTSRILLHIEVYPKHLVPDTNCFIDFLEELKFVSKTDNFLLMIPLVVVNELEGLSKGVKASTDVIPSKMFSNTERNDHLIKVANISKKSLEFIRAKNNGIRCVTTKGSVLVSSVFTLEDNDEILTSNDDKILKTALNLCKSSNKEKYDGDVLCIKTQVVLLTTDRNLRVKALSSNIIVSQLPQFVEWAGLETKTKNSLNS